MHGVIFDLDGTLADTVGDIARAGNHVLAERGLPTHHEPAYRRLVGDGAAVLIRRIVPADRADLLDELLSEFRDYYPRHMLDTTHAYDGVQDLLEALTADHVPMAVLSNKPDAMTRAMVRGLFPEVPFRAVWGQLPERPKKPDPAVALDLAAELRKAAAECLFVGDTPVDMETGRRAGMVPVGVAWGFRPAHELRAAGAEVVIERPSELLELLREAPPVR